MHVSFCFCVCVDRFISYPRTETNMFPESFDLTAIVRDQTPHPNWGGTYIYVPQHSHHTLYLEV